MLFYARVQSLLTPESTVLDVGCGRGAWGEDTVAVRRRLHTLKENCRRVIGIDVDPAGGLNPYLDEFRPITGPAWPVADESVDFCVGDFVLEHVPGPERFFARLIPNRLHYRVLRRVQQSRQEQDTFPTVYRCNTVGAVRRTLRRHGFDALRLRLGR